MTKPNVALIMPTINVPPNLREWSAQLGADDVIIIAGSGKTPHDRVRALLDELPQRTVYLAPNGNRATRWATSDEMPLNDHCRHALALLEAMTYEPQFILSLDDDNFPEHESWLTNALGVMNEKGAKPITEARQGWFNVGTLCDPAVVHRGYPLSRRHGSAHLTYADTATHADAELPVGVFAGLWLGDPDIDAVERIADDPYVTNVDGQVWLARNTWCPFNTQSTLWRNELSPLLLMWPFIGRFDDIWASYVARAWMQANGWLHAAGNPAVSQERNAHDLVKDLENELLGYRYTDHLINILRDEDTLAPLRGTTPRVGVSLLFSLIAASVPPDGNTRWLPVQTLRAFKAWTADLRAVEAGTMRWTEDEA